MRDFYNIIVVGGGHAGVEASFAAQKFGIDVALITRTADSIGRMSCNPSVGGLAKSRVVREVDAMGGIIGAAADMSAIQYRVLNRRKGPAVQATRAQCDRNGYERAVQKLLRENSTVEIVEDSVKALLWHGGKVVGVRLSAGTEIGADAVILTTGTFLGGKIFIGEKGFLAGRIGEDAEAGLSDSLKEMGLKLLRFKTGTPPRIDGRTVNYEKVQIQAGEKDYVPFSFETMNIMSVEQQKPCYITHTNEKTHDLIRENLLLSALYGGKIVGIGPRYCPSIEVKVEKFPQHKSHIVFLEPEGENSYELYPNGISNSLPEEIQIEMLHSISGLENVEMTRPGYAVEYDVIDPIQALPTLNIRAFDNLFLAGQILGTSGYEEAAGLGLLAGTNAALNVLQKKMITLPRHLSYIGVMVDDLVYRGADEPYRLLTGRAEYRLLLREDNAWLSVLEAIPKDVLKILSPNMHEKFIEWRDKMRNLTIFFDNKGFSRAEAEELHIANGTIAGKYLRRPDADWESVEAMFPKLAELNAVPAATFRVEMKYSGYIERQMRDVRQFEKMGSIEIPDDLDYFAIGLRREAFEKFNKFSPRNIGEASRIAGISPSDIAVLIGAIQKKFHNKQLG